VAKDRFVDDFEELQGPYVLGQLSAKEERELERHLEECPKCRQELDQIRHTHYLLRQLAANKPPAELTGQVLAQVRSEIPMRSGSGWRLWVSAAAAVLIVAVLGVGLFRTISDNSSSGVELAATSLAPEAGGKVQVDEVGENLQVELVVWSMPKLKADEYYEMWYYADDSGRNDAEDGGRNDAEDGGRISCGTFRVGPEGHTTVNLTAPASSRHYREIEITREPDNGDPGTSGEEVLEGKLRST
jgi:anti-sigma-K factor RskA